MNRAVNYRQCPNLNLRQLFESESDALRIHPHMATEAGGMYPTGMHSCI